MQTTLIDGTKYDLRHALPAQNGEPRKHDAWAVGDAEHQGDIIVVNIGSLPNGAKKAKSAQVVDGDTQGSRHVVTGGEVYDVTPEAANAVLKKIGRPEVGSVYVNRAFTGPATLTHPEHRHHEFPESVNLCISQRSQDAEEREARVRD